MNDKLAKQRLENDARQEVGGGSADIGGGFWFQFGAILDVCLPEVLI